MKIHNNDMPSEVEAAIAAGAALCDPHTPNVETSGAGVYAVVPHGYEITSLDEFLPRPLRIEQDVELHDADSFIGYVNAFKGEGTRVFFDTRDERFLAIVDYHQIGEPSWCEHAATFTPRHSVEFAVWTAHNKKLFSQVDFARFLEDNMPDIVEPASASLLEVALSFEAKKAVEFSSGVRLTNGQIQFQYDEIIRGSTSKGTIEIPDSFVLGISIHVNGPAYRIPVRLRWRLFEQKVRFFFEIVRPHRFIEDALKEIRDRIATEWRRQGRGPTFLKIGGRVFYRPKDIDAWIVSCLRIGGDPGGAA